MKVVVYFPADAEPVQQGDGVLNGLALLAQAAAVFVAAASDDGFHASLPEDPPYL